MEPQAEMNLGTVTQVPIATIDPPKRQDSSMLHFLKEFPAWCILTLLIGVFLTMWQLSHDDFIPRIIDGLVGALLTAIIAQRPRPNMASVASSPTSVTADTAEINSEETIVNVKEDK